MGGATIAVSSADSVGVAVVSAVCSSVVSASDISVSAASTTVSASTTAVSVSVTSAAVEDSAGVSPSMAVSTV